MSQDDSFRDSEMSKAVDTALRLWGHTFHGITTIRRENLLKVSDPKFVSLLKEPERFKPRQCSSLFGKAFIKEMVKEAKDDQQLKIISRGNGNSSATKPRSSGHSSHNRASSGYHRGSGGNNRGGSNGGHFNKRGFNSGFNKGGSSNNGGFNSNRYVQYSVISLNRTESVENLPGCVIFWIFGNDFRKTPGFSLALGKELKFILLAPLFKQSRVAT